MKLVCKYICALSYTLRMMGIPFSDPCFVYGDNNSVLYNTTRPESTLNKRNSSIAYHAVRERFATGEWLKTDTNVSDLSIKPVPCGKSRTSLVQGVMYYI